MRYFLMLLVVFISIPVQAGALFIDRDEAVDSLLTRHIYSTGDLADTTIALGPLSPIYPGDSVGVDNLGTLFSPTGETWFFFLDDSPLNMWTHPARLVFLFDDGFGGITDSVIHVEWRCTLNNNTLYPHPDLYHTTYGAELIHGDFLEYPAECHVDSMDGPLENLILPVDLSRPKSIERDDKEGALIIMGSLQLGTQAANVKVFKKALKDSVRGPGLKDADIVVAGDADNDGYASPNEIKAAITALNTKGCTKVYVLIASHGGNKSIELRKGEGEDLEYGGFTDRELAGYFKKLKACSVNILIDACQSKTLKDAMFDTLKSRSNMLAHSKPELIVAWSAAKDRASWYYLGEVCRWTELVSSAWQKTAADTDNNGKVSFEEALKYAKSKACSKVLKPLPDYEKKTDRNYDCSDPTSTAALSRLQAEPDQDGVRITWFINEREAYTGYHLYRAESDTEYRRINQTMIPDNAPYYPFQFAWLDKNVRSGVEYRYEVEALSAGCAVRFGPVRMVAPETIPAPFALYGNTPNPFNPSTKIGIEIPVQTHIRLVVFDAIGREITVLLDEERSAGRHEITWNGKSKTGESAPSGVYFVRMESGSFSDVRKLVLLR